MGLAKACITPPATISTHHLYQDQIDGLDGSRHSNSCRGNENHDVHHAGYVPRNILTNYASGTELLLLPCQCINLRANVADQAIYQRGDKIHTNKYRKIKNGRQRKSRAGRNVSKMLQKQEATNLTQKIKLARRFQASAKVGSENVDPPKSIRNLKNPNIELLNLELSDNLRRHSLPAIQPEAIKQLVEGIRRGDQQQVLLGVTGSGKLSPWLMSYKQVQKPTLDPQPQQDTCAQLYGEFKQFFPENKVEYFVSYYDYYQPEAYLPVTATHILKRTFSINQGNRKS
ncbi:MAG: hypothetical protein MZU84_01080 [Sphingobacterium sp.]|nr:hypothetical protein [Sphingobacterium sp.]